MSCHTEFYECLCCERLDAMRDQRDAAEQECERLKADINLALDRLHEAMR